MLPLWLLPSVAYALSCDEIMNMLNVNVPADIIVQTMEDSGERFTPDELQCLINNGATPQIIQQARSQLASEGREQPAAQQTEQGATRRDAAQPISTAQSEDIARQTAQVVMEQAAHGAVVVYVRPKGTLPEWFDPLTYRQELLSALPPGSRAVEQEVDPVRIIDHADAPALRAILARRDYHVLLYIELQPRVERLDVFYEMWMLQDGDRHVRTQYLHYEQEEPDVDDIIIAPGPAPATVQASGGSPVSLSEAIDLIKRDEPAPAALMLYDLLEGGAHPEEEAKINYYMGRALSEMGQLAAAQYHLLRTIRKGTSGPYFSQAFAELVSVANQTGNDLELLRLVKPSSADMFLDALPSRHHPVIHYLSGVRDYEDGSLSAAREHFSQIPKGSPRYLTAQYFIGIIYNEQGRLKSAVRVFGDVCRQTPEGQDKTQLSQALYTQDLALLNISRVYYAIERYNEAVRFAELLSEDTPIAANHELEYAWSLFMLNELDGAVTALDSLNETPKKPAAYEPEAEILRALILFQREEFEQAEQRLLAFEKKFVPIRDELRDFVTPYASKEGLTRADSAWRTYFGLEARPSLLSPQLRGHLTRDRHLRGAMRLLAMMDAETEALTRTHGLIRKKTHPWQDQLGPYLGTVIDRERVRYERRAGMLFLSSAAREANRLSELITQSEIIRFELVDALRESYQQRVDQGDL